MTFGINAEDWEAIASPLIQPILNQAKANPEALVADTWGDCKNKNRAMPETVNISRALKLPPRRVIRYFESKGYAISWNWWEAWQDAHATAFTVAKATALRYWALSAPK